MKKDLSLAQLRTFLRIVDRGNLTAAARDLRTTQPTVSRQLKELEASYGTVLVIRTTRSMRVTGPGRLVYEQAKQIVQADDVIRERLFSEDAQIEGRIRISAPSGFGAFVIAPFCARYVERNPGLIAELSLTDRQIDLISEGIDVSVRIGRLRDSTLYARPLAKMEEVLVCHPRYLSRPVNRPGDLKLLPWIVFTGLLDGDSIHLERRGRKQKIEIKPRLMIDQIVGHREALLAGAGAGLIHRYAIDVDIRAGRIAQLLPDWKLPEWEVHVVFPTKAQTYRVRKWCDELIKELSNIPGVAVG